MLVLTNLHVLDRAFLQKPIPIYSAYFAEEISNQLTKTGKSPASLRKTMNSEGRLALPKKLIWISLRRVFDRRTKIVINDKQEDKYA